MPPIFSAMRLQIPFIPAYTLTKILRYIHITNNFRICSATIPLDTTFPLKLQAKKAEKLRQKLGQGGMTVPDFKPVDGWIAPTPDDGEGEGGNGGGDGGGTAAAAAEGETGTGVKGEGIGGEVVLSDKDEDVDDDGEEESAFAVPASKWVDA